MAISDEVIRKNRQYLTQAQIDALVAAEKQFNNQNAGNRAGALANAREQYDTGYRGLQNMGLAGASGAQPTSGEVPRLEQQIRTPFEDYNNRLRDVERQRLGVLGENYAAQTRAAWAAEAERRRQEAYQRAVAAAQSMLSNIKTSITPSYVGPTLTDEEKAARKAQADGLKRTQQVKQQAFENGIGSLLSPVEKAQRDGMLRTARPQDVAAAAAFGKGNATISQQSDRYEKAYKEADATVRGMEMTRRYGGTVNEQDYQAAVQTRNEADTNRILDNYRKNDPEMFSAILTANSSSASSETKRKAYGVMAGRATTDVVNAMGFQKTMSDKEFNDATKAIPDIRMQLNIIDSTRNRMANGGTGGEKTIEEALTELKKLGYTEDEARDLVEKYNNDRNFMREYDYLNGAYTALYQHQGEKPTKPVNDKETDVTYRVVNRLPNKRSGASIDTETARYMTDEQRDIYNAIFEKEGAAAANEFAKAIVPIVEMKRAEDDQQWLEKLATEKGFPAWLLARGANLVGSIPAMVEKLAVNAQNISAGATGELKKYSPNSGTSRLSNWADIVQSKQSQNILEYYDKQERPGMGKFMNFMYNTGTSMADSLIAMGVSGVLGSGATDALFFSSAGNQAYKDAIQRGATQEQAMGLSFLSGTAEALFEHVSLEKLTQTLKFKGKPLTQAIKDAFTQAGVEGSEELFTEIADVLSDFAIMKDKSEMQEAINNGELGTYLWDHLSSATLGGLASGFLFGLTGVGGAALSQAKDRKAKSSLGSKVRENSNVQQVKNTAILLGGEAMQQAEQVQKHETDANVGEMTATVLNEIQSLGEELNQDQQVGLTRVLDGSEMTAEEAKDVHELLGKEMLEKFSYDAATPEAFQKSYNKRLQEHNVTSREETMQKASEERFTKQKKDAAARVWANPEQGLSLTTQEGNTIMPMPGNLRAVEQAEQERAGFKTRATATKGNVTYAVAGMQAREGLSNEQTYSEIQKGLTKEARQKAQLYEKLASALGVKMVIHDVMTGTNGFIDENGNMHVVLSGKQSVLRVAAHELTHLMKENAGNEYASMRDHLISEVGQEKFDRMTKQKANEYGIDLSTEKGKILADDEVCAELCERMLSNEDALEKFAEKDTAAAKTLKEHLLKILNAIKAAFKRAENRDFGESWSDLIKSQDTIESWITGLQKAIDNAGKKTAEKTDAMRGDLFLSEEDEARAERKKQAEANAEKGTYVRGISAKEMDSVLSNVMVGDKSNYEGDDYEHSRAMIAQLVPEVIDALNGEANLDDVQAKLETAVGEMVDNYFEEYGDGLPNLRSKIDATIGISDKAKGEIKYSEKNMRKVANEISHALGKRVTLVGETNPKFKTAQKLDSLWDAMNEDEVIDQKYNWSTDVNKLVDFINDQSADRVKLTGKERENTIYAQVGEMIAAVSDMLSEKTGKRYSLDVPHEGIEMKKPVEGTDKLIAIHNLTGDELSKSLARGGFPMPSIAIMKQSQGHNRYGDVSVIFGRDTIDPRKSSANKVYSGDAWTPTYPAIEHKPRKSVQDRIDKTYFDLQRRFGSKAADPLYRYVYEMEKQLNNAQSEKALLDNLYNDTALMQLYNQSVGNQRVEDVYKETKKEMTENEKTVPNFFIKELGEDFIRKYEVPKGETPLDYRREFIKKNRAELERAFGKMLRETFSFEQAENILEQTGNKEYHGILRRALKILDNETTTVERTFDYEATQAAIRNNVDQKAYRDWVYDLFHGIYEKSGIRNNKDYYTQSGNARSWDALHDEETLENVVRVMKQMEDKGSAAFFSQSGMLAVGTRDFKSIDEIRKHKDQLQHISDDEMSAAKSSIVEGFNELMEEMRDKRESNQFIARDRALDAMVEAVKQSRTPEGILRELKQWHGLNVTNDMGQRIADLVEEIANLPTEYFEAKPKRAVGANEIKTVILPEGKYSDLEKQLSDRGIPVVTYEYENDEDRLRALQSSEVSRNTFSLDTDYMRLAEKQKNGTLTKEDESKLRKMVDEAAKNAGYVKSAYHGTYNSFNVFRGYSEMGHHFGTKSTAVGRVGRGKNAKIMPVYLRMKNPITFDVDFGSWDAKYRIAEELQDRGVISDDEYNEVMNAKSDVSANKLLQGILSNKGYDSIKYYNTFESRPSWSYIVFDSNQVKSSNLVTYDNNGNIIPLSERFNTQNDDIRYSIDTDSIRQAFKVIDTEGIEDGLEALKDVKHVGSFALKDITRFLDASAGKNKDLRNTLHAIFEAPHSEATGRYAQGVERMQQKVLDIGKRAGVCDEKGKHFDSKKSAAIQNIGEGFSNTYTDLKLKVKDADHVTVRAYEPGTDKLVDSEKDYTLKELRQAYGTNAADYVWSRVFDETQKAQETGGKPGWVDEKVNTRPYTIDDLQTAYPNDWQKLKAAADEFRQMYDEYIRDQNNMLATIYPIESEYADVEKLDAGIEKKQERLAQHKAAVNTQIENLQKSLEAKEKEIASKKRTDTKAYRQLVEQANKLTDKIAEVKAEIAEYEANAKDELMKMNVLKAEMQNAVQKGDYSLKRMHRLQYRSDYFHHFTEMASGIQNLKSIFTNNTDIAPAIVGKSENTKAKTRWAGYFQQRMGGDYTADALNGMLRYGQLAEYKLAFDPLTAYLRDVNKQIRNMSGDTNRDGLIRYIDQWADTIAGKSHKLDRVVSDSGMAPRKAMQVLQWINSRVIQNTLLFNMRSALIQISNITNAKGIVKNNIDWVNGLKAWALAAKGDEAMASIMAQSNFLASRYMDGLALTDSKLKSAKQFAGWMLGALDEVSAKATWWAAYQQYTRNPNAAKNQYRNYDSAVDYADDITRRTHAGRGVGELAPAMTSRVINFVAPFQVEVNNTWQLLKDNVKQKNYLGLLSTGLSVFLFNTFFETIVGSTPLGFDFIRAVVDIALGFLNDDPDDDPDAKEIAQRFAGELVGGLPFASQLVAAFGEDNAKKLLGENNDATRYGNTQIGVNAVVNAAKGLKDIGTGLIEGRRVNWLDDLDDLMNLTLPMGAKQLTRTAQGLATVAKGYAGKYDKEGNEKVQFVTDQDVLHYIHAGLFGKWALTEASEYFGEKRLLPQLFGKYNGPKSSIGNMVDAKEYKAALKTGIDGKQYFNLKYDLKKYTTQAGKRAEMMEQSFTSEQKAQLDALLIADSKKGSKAEGSVVYQKDNDGNWTVKADYSSKGWMDVAELGDTKYNQAKESGIKPETFASICTAWKGMSGKDKKDQAREYLNSLHLTKDQYDYVWTNVFKYKAE